MRLRGTAFLAVTLVTAFLGVAANPAQASHTAVVSISGSVTNADLGLTLQVGAVASGPVGSLSGQGFDAPTPGMPAVPGTPAGYCRLDLTTGSLSGDVVTLSGSVEFSNDPVANPIGTPVSYTADASTGEITFDFAGFIFTGTGKVRIAHR